MTKTKLRSYLLWFLLGGFGAHRFYLRRRRSGFILLGYTLLTTGFEIFASEFMPSISTVQLDQFYWITAVPLWIFLLVDAFKISRWVEAINAEDHGPAVFD